MLIPVIRGLIDSNRYQVLVLGLTTAANELNVANIPCLRFKDFFDRDAAAREYGLLLIDGLDNIVDKAETICYMGRSFLDLVETIGEENARKVYNESGRQVFYPFHSLKIILEKLSPNLLVITNAPRAEKAAGFAARALGIPCIALVDMFAVRCLPWFKQSNFADKVLVLNESVRSFLIEAGRDSNSVFVTGNPSFDTLVASRPSVDKIKGRSLYRVLWASQSEPSYVPELGLKGDPSLHLDVEEQLLKIFKEKGDWVLRARNHPSETPRVYPSYVEYSPQTEPLDAALRDVDVVVTLCSTVGFQGVLMGADMVTIDSSVFTHTMPYSKLDLSTGIKNISELPGVLSKIRLERKTKDLVSKYDISDATHQVINHIDALLDSLDSP